MGEMLSCSFVEPANDADRSGETMPCVIYMHGNAGNKMEGLQYAEEVAAAGMNMCCFDFSGCGKSEGEWVTLGHKEKDDLKCLIEYLHEYKKVSIVGLWGRSMGAVASLLYMKENAGTVKCAVMDSGFSSLTKVIDSMAGMMGVPPEFVQMLFPMIESAVEEKANFKISELNAEPAAKECVVPAFFLHASGDDFIIPDHSVKNHAAYGGSNKVIKYCEGDHNTPRPASMNTEIVGFLKANM